VSDDVSKILESLSSKVAPAIIEALEQASNARNLVKAGSTDDGPADIHDQLVSNRKQIERLEHLTSTFVLLKSRAAQQVAAAKGKYEDAYMGAATKPSLGFNNEYVTAKEKDAHYNLSTVAETLELRRAEALYRDVESAHEFCRLMLRGAEGVQRDAELRMRLMSLTSAMEK